MQRFRPLYATLSGLLLAAGATVCEASEASQTAPQTRAAQSRTAQSQPAAAAHTKADRLAASVLDKLGGRAAWDDTRYLTWSFFGVRRHLWDRQTGDVRVEYSDRESGESIVILMNLRTKTGRAWRAGEAVAEGAALDALLERGYGAWVNDSYWLVMPYKLRDPGVELKHLGERELEAGGKADVLELRFESVGLTPDNKYDVYVARDSGLVAQWDFYRNADDEEPAMSTPWAGWKRHGGILLPKDFGNMSHADVAVLRSVPPAVLTDAAEVDWAELIAEHGE